MAESKGVEELLTSVYSGLCEKRCVALKEMIAAKISSLRELIESEEKKRALLSDESRLKKAVGGFGEASVNISSIKDVLHKGEAGRVMPEERFNRIKCLLASLSDHLEGLDALFPRGFKRFSGDMDGVLNESEGAMNSFAPLIGDLRKAELELSAKYNEKKHDSFFEGFSWRDFTDEEFSLICPYLLFVDTESIGKDGAFGSALVRDLIELFSLGRPIKVLLLRNGVENLSQSQQLSGREISLAERFEIETLPLFLRKLYTVQLSVSDRDLFEREALKALESVRCALISVSTDEELVRCRAVPQFLYDPDKDDTFSGCFSLLPNDDLERTWPLDGDLSQNGYTFGDYVASLGKFSDLFQEIEESPYTVEDLEKRGCHLSLYLELSPDERKRRIPFVFRGKGKDALKVLPSPEIMVEAAEKASVWQILRELSGVCNPYVEKVKSEITERLTSEKEAALKSLRDEFEGKIKEREREAVRAAMVNLAKRLSGMGDASDITAKIGAGVASSGDGAMSHPHPPTEELRKDESSEGKAEGLDTPTELPWVETDECTSCDECITINKNIFAYNEEKKCYIKDPKGGPYRDLVKAAESCPAMIIHPGLPLDPNEKGLDALIKRAEKFN
ncbi:MAG: ferredoxin [Candidatus Dadabacteria bacterium]|nr:MAG: ferredoxin [Candidatus Dadabacteria bacterium]